MEKKGKLTLWDLELKNLETRIPHSVKRMTTSLNELVNADFDVLTLFFQDIGKLLNRIDLFSSDIEDFIVLFKKKSYLNSKSGEFERDDS